MKTSDSPGKMIFQNFLPENHAPEMGTRMDSLYVSGIELLKALNVDPLSVVLAVTYKVMDNKRFITEHAFAFIEGEEKIDAIDLVWEEDRWTMTGKNFTAPTLEEVKVKFMEDHDRFFELACKQHVKVSWLKRVFPRPSDVGIPDRADYDLPASILKEKLKDAGFTVVRNRFTNNDIMLVVKKDNLKISVCYEKWPDGWRLGRKYPPRPVLPEFDPLDTFVRKESEQGERVMEESREGYVFTVVNFEGDECELNQSVINIDDIEDRRDPSYGYDDMW